MTQENWWAHVESNEPTIKSTLKSLRKSYLQREGGCGSMMAGSVFYKKRKKEKKDDTE